MHTPTTARETLQLLWNNFVTLSEQVDLDAMPMETLQVYIDQNASVRPFRIAAWLARQGYFIAAWSLWEFYSRNLCETLSTKEKQASNQSTVEWIGKSLAVNNICFSDQDGFKSANSLRNLVAHWASRTDGSRAKALLERSRLAFPDIETWQDGYINLTRSHTAEPQSRIDEFIRRTA